MSGEQGARPKLAAVKRPESEAVRKVKSGEMSLEEYLEQRTEEALNHIRGKISEDTLETVRFVLREKIRTDPLLVEAVRRTTGVSPRPFGNSGKS